MSSFLFGQISDMREQVPAGCTLILADNRLAHEAQPDRAAAAGGTSAQQAVHLWVDRAAALVPAEVLGLHALLTSLGTTTAGDGQAIITEFTDPAQTRVLFWGLVAAACGIYLLGVWFKPAGQGLLRASKEVVRRHIARGIIASAAFVAWTMIQPSTAFDSLGLDLPSMTRVMIGSVTILVLLPMTTHLATTCGPQLAASTPEHATR